MNTVIEKHTSGRGRWFLLLHAALLLFSCTGVLSKSAAARPFLSLPFILFYGGMFVVLGIYAVLWQQVLKHLPVTLAYTNKAVTVVWGMLFGMLVFREHISSRQLIGAAVVIAGCVLYVLSDREVGREGSENGREETAASPADGGEIGSSQEEEI